MSDITILDEEKALVRVGAGCRWGQVAQILAPHDWIITSGNFGDVGVGGLTVAGGIGYFTKTYGLTINRLVSATVVCPDGKIYQVSEDNHSDLFWAIRGGMTQVGLVTEYVFKAQPMASKTNDASVGYLEIDYQATDLSDFLDKWSQLAKEAPDYVASFLSISQLPEGTYFVHADNVCSLSNEEIVEASFAPFYQLDPVVKEHKIITSYANVIPFPKDVHDGSQPINVQNALVDTWSKEIKYAVIETVNHPSVMALELRTIGGQMNKVEPHATAFSNRHQEYFMAAWLMQDDSLEALRAVATGCYGGYSSVLDDWVVQKAWDDEARQGLLDLAKQYDPHHVFNTGLQVPRT
ncbi:FAD-binding oxidoreductase [Streptococcus sp. zg-JUN1979]|uniref:FAD-binding oxidoreductase n=1 Tax=Streptococcus sp. zg-JUN1979 TaxID=3391450 RepID=UPI0039A6E552